MKKIFLITLFSLLTIFLTLLVFSNLLILQNHQFFSESNVPTTTIGLIFGGGMNPDGTMGAMQASRVSKGVALYKAGKVKTLMMTGDDGAMYSDEVDAMSAAAVAAGVPTSSITVDRHGYRTYESCYREAKIFGLKKVIAVSQAFHLPRIIYFCKNFGIEVSAVPAASQKFGWDSLYMGVREMGARLKAVWQVDFSKPLPRNLSRE